MLAQDPKYKFFLYANVFHCLCFVYFEVIQTQNRRPNNIDRKSNRKVAKLKSKFSLILGKLNRALNNPAQELCF